MIDILIVDDEEILCQGLRLKIESTGIEAIGRIVTCSDPVQALERCRTEAFDLLVTDIRMPEMDGIELIGKVKAIWPAIQVIVLSGFDDFESVRKSFRLGVEDYLLKPSTISEIGERIRSAIAKIEDGRDRNGVLARTASEEETLLGRFCRLIRNPAPKAIPGEALVPFEPLFPYRLCQLMMIGFRNGLNSETTYRQIRTVLLDAPDEQRDGCVVHCQEGDGYILVFLNARGEEDLGRYLRYLRGSVDPVVRTSDNLTLAVLSHVGEGILSFRSLYHQCTQLLKYRILYPDPVLLDASEVEDRPKGLVLSGQELKDFRQSTDAGFVEYLLKRTWNQPDGVKRHRVEDIENTYLLFADRLRALLAVEEPGPPVPFQDFDSFEEIRLHLMELLVRWKTLLQRSGERDVTAIGIARRYVEENLEKEIDMAVVANLANLNYSYFSELFKKQMGIGFSGYVTKVRMEAARRLLENPSTRIQDVAARTGYESPKHFARAFKNHFGVTPSEYQKGGS